MIFDNYDICKRHLKKIGFLLIFISLVLPSFVRENITDGLFAAQPLHSAVKVFHHQGSVMEKEKRFFLKLNKNVFFTKINEFFAQNNLDLDFNGQ